MSYEYYYNNARNRYYNACSEINSCQNKLNDLKIDEYDSIKVKIGVKKDAANRGGINLFGSKAGNFNQDLKLTIQFE